ncbi:MAG TPA: hypothetical protein DEP85_08450 [Holosporales bacterium]|nr:hypothetical protein [Holosporales bacterium]
MPTSSPSSEQELSPFRTFFWHVYPQETKTVALLCIIFFLIVGTNAFLLPFHTSLLVTAPNSGTEVIGYLRIFGELPLGILYILGYNWLSLHFSKPTVVLINYIGFISIYLLFGFYILSNNNTLIVNPDTIASLMETYPLIKWVFPVYGNWTMSILFVLTEIWAGVPFSQFFWQTANHFTITKEARRIYPLFIISAGSAGIVAIPILKEIIHHVDTYHASSTQQEFNLLFQTISVATLFLSLIIYFLFRLQYKIPPPAEEVTLESRQKEVHPSAINGFHYLLRSPYLIFILLTLLASENIYSIVNLLWKAELLAYDPHTADYNYFLTNYVFLDSVGLFFFAILSRNLINRLGWHKTVYITPLLSLFVGLPFLILFFFFQETQTSSLFGLDSHELLAIFGAGQNALMHSSMSCFYFPTKEMTYIPLPRNVKTEGKAAADILGNIGGLALAGLIQEGLLILSEGTDLTIAPYLIVFLFFLFWLWIYATRKMDRKYSVLLNRLQQTERSSKIS